MSAVYPVGATKLYGETLALSTTLASLGIPPGMKQAILYAPNNAFRFHLNPRLKAAYFYDDSAADGAEYTDIRSTLSDRTQGAATTTTLPSSMTTSDKISLVFDEPVGGLHIDITLANATAAVMTV